MKASVIDFKPLTEADLTLLYDWFHKPHIKQWYARNADYTLEMLTAKYLPRVRHPALISSFIIYVEQRPIGYIQRYHVSHWLPAEVADYDHPLFASYRPQEIAGLDMFIAEEDYLGAGYATVALQHFIDTQIRGQFAVLVVDPMQTNQHAIHFFERNGFNKLTDYHSQALHELLLLHVT
jgi:aminoglycoside 6'-N-acetyltransferase